MLAKNRYLQLILALGFIAFIVYEAKPTELLEELRHVDLLYVAPAILLNLPIALLTPLRASLVLRRQGYKLPIGFLIPSTIVGFVLGSLTPAAAGEIVRAEALRSAGIPFETGVSLVIFERLMAGYLLLISTMVFLVVATTGPAVGILAIAAGLVLVAVPWLLARALPLMPDMTSPEGSGLPRRLIGYFFGMAGRIRYICAEPRILLSWSAITVVIIFLTAVQYLLVARSVGGHISIDEAWMAFGLSAIIAIASLIPFGLGFGDGSLAAILHRFGMSFQESAAAAILVRAAVTIPLIAIALVCQLILHRSQLLPGDRPAAEL